MYITHYSTCYLCISLRTDITKIIIMTGIVASVTGIIILYIKIYKDVKTIYGHLFTL